jgi:SAM-dependent methyltransferase
MSVKPDSPQMAWYKSWFNSPYYHILYENHNFEEAETFIDNLIRFLQPNPGARILDLACGRGRHAYYLCKKGFQVTGIDLSPQSIYIANRLACRNLDFQVADMRETYKTNAFDFIFNFFTSFGYFDHEDDNLKILKAIHAGLKEDGRVMIDFMNTQNALKHLKESDVIERKNITFHIKKQFKDKHFLKWIEFKDQGNQYRFVERVQAIDLETFKKYFKASGLKLMHTFGNYNLDEFDPENSERLILIAQKSK